MTPATPESTAARKDAGTPGASRIRTRPGWTTAALLAPAYGWLTFAVLLPLGVMLFFSVLKAAPFGNRPLEYTFDNYLAFIRRPYLFDIAWTSIQMGLWTTGLCALIGLPAAVALARATRGRAKQVIFLLVVLPFWTNGLVRVFSWTMVLQEGGILDYALRLVAPSAPSLSVLYSFPAIIIGLVHAYLPYMILTCYLSTSAIEDASIEAARSLGARTPVIFWKIILPLSLPGLTSGSILIFVPVIGSFMEPRILGGRVGVTMGTVIEDQFVQAFNWPLGAALSFTMLAVVLIIFAASSRLLARRIGMQ
jgi:spermidine/putrescine transport system permease protein